MKIDTVEVMNAVTLARLQARMRDENQKGGKVTHEARRASREFAINQLTYNLAHVMTKDKTFNREQFLIDCGVRA